ncbi:MAG: hypothetical protein WCK09_13025, partial [Bacteroidota bacterium]
IDVVPVNIDHNALLHYDATQHFFQKTIDTVNTALSGLVKATTGKLSAIADHSSNWDAGYAYRLTSATGVAPLTLTLASNGLTGSMPSASASANGYLKSTDWTAFNSKQNALTTGSVTAGSNKITLTGSPANSIIGPGFSIDVVPVNIDHNALLHYDAAQHFFQKTIDTINTALSGLVKATTGKLSAIADHSSNWDAGYAYRLTTATGTAPLTLTLAANGLTGSMPPASASVNGYLKSTDWTTFNSKQNALITGSVTAGSNKITLTGTPANSIIGPGFSIDVVPLNIDHNALLHYDATQHFFQKTIDTVNTALSGLVKATTGKLSAIADNSTNWDDGYAYRLTSATGTAPLTLTLASNILTGSMPPASASVNGYLKSTDWSTFNGKESVLTFNSPLNRAGNIISLPAASGGQNGYLSGSDYARLHGTSGSILFYDGNGIQQDNSNCYFDNSTNRMGIGTSNPQATFAVGASSQFQVASDGHCTVTGAFGSISPLTGINTTGTGVTGTGTVYGVYGQSTIPAGERAGGYFYTSSSAYARVGGFKQSSPGIFEAYLIWGIGKLVTQNKSPDGLMADLYAPVCPETVITDYGSGQLKNGKCHIEIDPLITKRIYVSREYPVKVFIQLEEDCKGVYVTNKSAEGFDVVELMGGTSDANFSWSFTANISDVTSPDGEVESKNIGVRSTEYITKNTLK